MSGAIDDGLRHLAERFSVDRSDWRAHFRGGDELLDGLVSHGYAIERDGRFAASLAGLARLQERVPVEESGG